MVLEGQLDIERLVAELSVQFINLPADQIDEAIRTALRRIGEALQLGSLHLLPGFARWNVGRSSGLGAVWLSLYAGASCGR